MINGAGRGSRIHGTRGTLQYEDQWRISGDGVKGTGRLAEILEVEDEPETLHHMANWLDCVRRRDTAGLYCPVKAGYGHSVACILSAEAFWSGRRTEFDPQKRSLNAV